MLSRRRFLERCGRCAAGLVLGGTLVRGGLAVAGGKRPPTEEVAGGDPLGLGVEQWTRTVCDLCGLAEPVFVGTRAGAPVAVKGIPLSTVGFGRLCPRARALVAAAVSEARATRPLVRRDAATKGTLEGLAPASWDEALAAAAAGLRAARERLGPGGVAIFSSDGETCETYALLGRLARLGLSTDHLDTPARLDALHAYRACAEAFGVPANPGSVEDVDAATLIVMVGGEVAESHPALFARVLDARRTGRAKVALIDGRKTEAALVADLHLRPRPGGELAVLHALHSGTASVGAALREAGVDGAAQAALRDAWRSAARAVTLVGPTALSMPTGAALARAVARLHRSADQWGEIGKGPLFLPRGANATGVVAFGLAPGLLPAGGRLAAAADRARFAEACGVSPDRLPRVAGLPSPAWPAAIRAGRIGALLVHRANLAAEMPDALAWREALGKSFVVATATHVPSETTVHADVVLPVALVSGETAGTMMTLDRCCQALARAGEPAGEARPADRIAIDLARHLLGADALAALAREDWTPYAEWDRWRQLSAGTSFEASGISPVRLGQELDVAWPCAAEDQPGTARLARASAPPGLPPAPGPGGARRAASGHFVLVTGPQREHFRSRVITGRSPDLHYESPAAQLEMHPEDGRRLGLADGDWVTVESPAGAASARLWLTERAQPGVVFLPEHYGFLSDLQGGSYTQKEPEGLAHRVTGGELLSGSDSPAGLAPQVTVRKAHRRDLRQRGI